MKHLPELEIRRALAENAGGNVMGYGLTPRDRAAIAQQLREAGLQQRQQVADAIVVQDTGAAL